MEPTFIALREYLADGLERPFLNLGDDIREAYLDSPLRFLARCGFGMILGIFLRPQKWSQGDFGMDIAMSARMMRLWAARTRIACFFAVIMPFAVFARTILVPPQPVSPYLDTEVSTNCVLHRSRIDARTFDVQFQFEGTPTNSLEVAFGRDSNTNGVLDVQEIDTVYGWRGGRYFIENVRAWERIETVAATNALCGVIDIHLENGAELVPRRFTASCGGEAAFTQFATPPSWLFRSDWTLMKVTRRGVGVPSEWIRCDIVYNCFTIRIR